MIKTPFLWLSPYISRVGKRFNIDAHYFVKNSTLVILGQVVSILRGLVTGYLVARFFRKEVYGEYQFMLSVVGMLSIFTLPGMSTAVARAWVRNDPFSFRKITIEHLKVCLIGSIFLLLCIPFLHYYHREELWLFFVVAAILFPLGPLSMVRFGSFTVGKAKFDLSLKASLVWSVIIILCTLAIIAFYQSPILLFLSSVGVPSFVYLYFSRNMHPPREKDDKNSRAIVRYAWHLSLASFPVDAVWYIDRLLISHFFGLAELAAFSVANLIPEQGKVLLKQFIPILFSKQATKGDSLERRRKLAKAVFIGTIIFAVGIAFYIVLCPLVIPWLFPNYDAKQVILLTSIAAATLIVMPSTLFAQYLEAQGMVKEVHLSNWIPAAVFGVSLFVLIPWYGLVGALLARGLFRLIYAILSYWFVMHSPIRD